MSGPPDIRIAEAKVKAARAQLFSTIGEVQERLKPSHLAQDAMDRAAQGVSSVARMGAEAVRSRPLALAAVTGAIGLVMARGWIGNILRNRRARKDETPASAKGLKAQPRRAKSARGQVR